MENQYKRKFEELQRCYLRVENLYNWKIINEKWECSFWTPKDLFLNFFRVSYELKENLKIKNWFWWYSWLVEKFCNSNDLIWLSLDITNIKKHWENNKPRTIYNIWEINTWIHIFDPNWKDRTEISIEINWKQEDWLKLIKDIFRLWEFFLKDNNLL